MMLRFNKVEGFTLVEVMVALAIFAAAAGLLMVSEGNSTRSARYLHEKILATELVENILNQKLAIPLIVSPGETSYLESYQDRQWTVRERWAATSVTGFYRLKVDVFANEAATEKQPPLSSLTTFIREARL
ncbi:MAG: type II secretion system minor pseudopilin GspI [Endozoicomonas sp.]|uniref:type II secretion system minor pseudopilin GspI n=1 Tax=Endozoicomonas sp. TaxID=1892382 RepID=UPI003D9BF984